MQKLWTQSMFSVLKMTHWLQLILMLSYQCLCGPAPVAELCVSVQGDAKWFIHKWPEGGSSAANKCEHSISHSECALKAIYIVKSNYPSSMREYLISILNRAEHIIKKKKGAFLRWRWLTEQRNQLVHNSALPF